ncbi:hypothetical protein GOV13_04120 [Candidatus Pacearchaeota archaeon]|nr:hypothetical protein [Candidatus Pacearchaeota archaeon]
MKLKIFNRKETKRIVDKLNRQFGVEEIQGIFIQMGKERLFLFQGSFSRKEIIELSQISQMERVGVYFGKEIKDEVRLSMEGAQLLKDQITKNIFELNSEQAEQWMKGQELLIETGKKDFLVMKYNDNFLGCGKASEKKIGNYIPKNRRLKEKNLRV